MQLREYFAILRRFWPLLLLLPLLSGALSLFAALGQPVRYQASARLMVSHIPLDTDARADLPDYNSNFTWLTSEYILDDLPQVVNSVVFATDVAAALSERGLRADVAQIQGGLSASVLHRSVYLVASADSPELALAIVDSAVESLKANGLSYWGRAPAGDSGLYVATLDPPGGVKLLGSTRELLVGVALRVALASAAAIGLAFLIYYLDDRVRGARQAERMLGLRVLAVIPKE